ncbi:MAG: hypothetical protein H6Q63_1336, partial [Firmicutes bacterium]|nr:hypothetical protein [Bacillota bacterium]
EGWLEVKPGRNSRYGRFSVISKDIEELTPENVVPVAEEKPSRGLVL